MTVILVIHILASLVLVGVVLLQRSEGGALGIGGGGGGGGGLMSGRGAAGALVRTTIIFGAIFFVTSLTLTTMSTHMASDSRTDIERQLDEEYGGDPLDVTDPSQPLLDDSSSAFPQEGSETGKDVTATPEEESASDPLAAETGGEDPLAADVPSEGGDEEAVDEPQQ
ncbi:preprotein translocase subunit SecG [Henriciella aquimarina]|uniref:preprotein translocase subunit SecG n=1 Tax=Henriciella aquimarina TaxID=545261 RepID=UPI0009FF5328|nr:preprotein translocase subunit SecG [Henriciella aquimarina]